MPDSQSLAQLYLTGTLFHNQPTCWQNFVREIKREHPDTYGFNFQNVTNQKLEAWRLTYVRAVLAGEHSMIQGAPEDLTALDASLWMMR